MKKLIRKIITQKKTSPFLGAIISVYTSTAILYSPLTLIGVATTLYGLFGEVTIKKWLPWFSFPVLLAFMIVFILIMMVIFNKIVIPSMYAFQVQQQYKHQNPLVTDMKLVIKKLDEINKRLDEIEGKK